MNQGDLVALTQEIEEYKNAQQYVECILRMDHYERETTDPIVKAVLLTAKATCALEIGDIEASRQAVSLIDTASLTIPMRNYVNLTKATVAHEGGQSERAAALLAESLATGEIYSDEQREVLYEALARMGFIQADMNQFDAALGLLSRASAMFDRGDLQENIGLYRAYCLQALGRLQEAEECLQSVLRDGSGEFNANVYYRLGAIHLQQGHFVSSIADFQNALTHRPRGRIRRSDILAALSEAESARRVFDNIDDSSARSRGKPGIQ
jgi:tetratricopeptide (TPR) repeat protein